MPQVASALVIPSQKSGPAARGSASTAANDSPGAFGDVLDAAAGPDTSSTGGASAPGKAEGGDKSKLQGQSKPPDAVAQIALADPASVANEPAPVAQGGTGPAAAAAVEVVGLAQDIPAAPAAVPAVPTAKTAAAEKGAAGSDRKSDGTDDAAVAIANADVTAITVPAASIVAVAVMATPAAVPAMQPDTGTAGDISPIGAQPPAANAVDATPGASAQDSAAGKSQPIAATAVLASVQEPAEAAGTPDETVKPAAAHAGAIDPADQKAAAAGGAPSDAPDKPGETAGIASTQAKSSPEAQSQAASPKAQAGPADASAVQGAKSKGVARGDTKAAPLKSAAEAPQAAARAAEPDSDRAHAADQEPKAPVARIAHEQGSEHAAAPARVFGGAQSDAPAPTSLAQAPATQSSAPSLPGITLTAPLASPSQAVWQAAPDRPDTSDKAVPIAGVAVEIVSRAQDGIRHFEIRLDPPELGRIDVRLHVDNGGNVTSRLTVERPETLDLLRRDAPQLERALQHAGLNTEGGLQFSLRDQNFANRQQQQQQIAPTFIIPDDEPAAAAAARRGYGRLIGLGGGIDIRV